MAAAVAGGGRRGGVRDRAGPDVQGGDVRVHHQGEVRGLAQAGVHCRQEKGQAVLVLQPGGEMDHQLAGSDGIPVPDPSRTFFQVPDPSRPEN